MSASMLKQRAMLRMPNISTVNALSTCITIRIAILVFMVATFGLLLISETKADESDTTKMVFTKAINSDEKNVVFFEILEPSTLRYIFKSKIARNFGTSFNQSYTSVELVVGDPSDGCSGAVNSKAIRGNCVLFVRGGCSFVTKALTAEAAGAMFVIVTDNDEGNTRIRVEMVHDETNRKVHLPALFIAGKDGFLIRKELEKNDLERFALLNIPINLTSVPFHKRTHPPWTVV